MCLFKLILIHFIILHMLLDFVIIVIYILFKEGLFMKFKSIISLSLFTTLTFGTVSPFINTTSASAISNVTNVTNKTQHSTYKTASLRSFKLVRSNHAVKIYRKASTKSRILDNVKNDQGVVVLKNFSNGWTKVSLQFTTGFIQSKYLISPTQNKNTPYAMNLNKTYSFYNPGNKGSGFKTYYKAKFKTSYAANKTLTNFWYLNAEPDSYGKMEYETSKGLYTGYKEIGIASLAVKYPVKINKTWTGIDGQTLKIVAKNKTVKTKTGTYKNVVVVKAGKGKNYSYYAPYIGLIKQIQNGKTITELASINQ